MADGTIIIDTRLNSDGVKNGVGKLSGIASKGLGTIATAGKIMAAGIATATTAVVGLTKASIEQYAEYEQLVGGVETLFKTSSDKVMQYADNAYKTAGLSANEYMNTITGFSASLLQGLGGDTEKAAQIGNQAVTDMADNANKMGTSMESIQNAYQGFAKQNYTMLDNLKLGYGGTKEEMQRLLTDAEKLTGVHYDINNFSDVIQAIHAVQDNLGITGTTAKEAMSTISGSLNMVKASWKNVLTGMADDDADFGKLIDNLVESVGAFGENIIPRVEIALNGVGQLIERLLPVIMEKVPGIIANILPGMVKAGTNIVTSLGQGLLEAMPTIVNMGVELINTLLTGLMSMLPQILKVGIQAVANLIQGIAQQLPTLIPMAIECIMQLINTLIENLPLILDAGMQLLQGLIDGIIQALPIIIEQLPVVIQNICDFISVNLPTILQKGVELLQKLIQGIIQAIPQLVAMLPQIIDTIITFITTNLPTIIEMGVKLLVSLIEGLIDAIPQLIAMLPQIISTIVSTLASHLGEIVKAGIEIIVTLAGALIQAIPQLVGKIPEIVSSIFEAFGNVDWSEIGMNIIEGIGNGLASMGTYIWDKACDIAGDIKDGFCSFFGIHSPSRLMRDLVGTNIVKGIGVGMDKETPSLSDDAERNMHKLYSSLKGAVDVETAKTTTAIATTNIVNNYNSAGVSDSQSKNEIASKTVVNKYYVDGKQFMEALAPYADDVMDEWRNGR